MIIILILLVNYLVKFFKYVYRFSGKIDTSTTMETIAWSPSIARITRSKWNRVCQWLGFLTNFAAQGFGTKFACASRQETLSGWTDHFRAATTMTSQFFARHFCTSLTKTRESNVMTVMEVKRLLFVKFQKKQRFYDDKDKLVMRGMVRSRQETVNKRLKQFNCLKTQFRHDVLYHGTFFRAAAVLTQLSLKHIEPLFQVQYDD